MEGVREMKIQRGGKYPGMCYGCGHFAGTGVLQVVDINFKNGKAELIMGTLCSDKKCREAAQRRLQNKVTERLRLRPRVRIRTVSELLGHPKEIVFEETA